MSGSIRNGARVSAAFLRLGLSTAMKYPLGLASEQLRVLGPVLIYFFIAGFVDAEAEAVGGDYFTYVMVGLVGMQSLNAGLRALSNQIDQAVSRGWFETVLVEPVPWPLLPYAMSLWPVVNAGIAAALISIVSLLLGASIDAAGIPMALLIGGLGVIAGLAIGSLAASLKVLAKRGDPILTFYSLAALVFSGVFFPIDQVPEALRPLSFLFVHTYVIAGMRSALMGLEPVGATPGQAALALAGIGLVMVPISIWLFGRAMEYGRRMGLLAGY